MTALTGIALAPISMSQAAAISATVTTVKQALTAKDDTPVKLHGQVVKSIEMRNISSETKQVLSLLM